MDCGIRTKIKDNWFFRLQNEGTNRETSQYHYELCIMHYELIFAGGVNYVRA